MLKKYQSKKYVHVISFSFFLMQLFVRLYIKPFLLNIRMRSMTNNIPKSVHMATNDTNLV